MGLRRRFATMLLAASLPVAAGCGQLPAQPDPDAEFRATAERVADRTSRRVIAWGEAPLSDDDQPRRFAVLDPDEPGEGRGAYLIEDRPDALWLVSYDVDGRTLPWGLVPGASLDGDPAWQARTEPAVEHAQAHPRGGEETQFALRDGTLVVLEYAYTGDADTEVTERQRFASRGVCERPCPPLRGFVTEDAGLRTVGPAADADALLGQRSKKDAKPK